MGIPTNATMLYGHIESVEDRVDHLLRLRELQDETGGFVTYIPLAFQPWEAPAMKLPETTGFEDLKAIAVGRLLLDNFPHIKSYWIMIGPRLAQVGLSFGADDIDGTVTEEKIAHDAGAQTAAVHDRPRAVPADARGGPAAHRARHRLQRGEGVVTTLAAPGRPGPAKGPRRAAARGRVLPERRAHRPRARPATRASSSCATCPRAWPSALHAGEIDLGIDPVDRVRGRATTRSCRASPSRSRGPVRSVSLLHRGPARRPAARRPRHVEPHQRGPAEGPAARAPRPRPRVRADGAVARRHAGRGRRGPRHRRPGARTSTGAVPRLDLGEEWQQRDGPAVRLRLLGRAPGRRRRPRTSRAPAGGPRAGPARRSRDDRGVAMTGTARRRPGRTSPTCAENIVFDAGRGRAGGPARVLPRAPTPSASIPRVPELRFHGHRLRRSAARSRRASGSRARRGSPSSRDGDLLELGALADAVRWRLHPEARRHLHHRPQHQLHERLHRPVRVLRLLPRPALEGGLPALEGRSSRRRSRRRSRSAARRSCCRAACTPTSASSSTRSCSAG